jgi:hypothetical protein
MTENETEQPTRFKDLCIDACDIEAAAGFWSSTLDLTVRRTGQDVSLVGPTPSHTIWMNQVPEPKTVKNRVHLDVLTGDLAQLHAPVVQPADADRAWTVLTDPDGQEFCAFVRAEVPDYRLYEVVIDCAEPEPLARWWASVLGGELQSGGDVWGITKMPGVPFEYLVFVPVPEAKTIKNRVHLDVNTMDLQSLVTAGASLLRARGGDISWHVLADPAGNEFCAFELTANLAETASG